MNSAPFLGMISQLPTLQTVTYSGQLPPWKGQRFFLLKWTFTLDIDLTSLHTMFLPKLPPVDLQNALSMVMVLYTRCFWSRSSLHSKWSNTWVCCCVQSLSHVRIFATPSTAARQASLSSTISRGWLKFMSLELVIAIQLSHLLPLFSPLAFNLPASEYFPVSLSVFSKCMGL